MVEFDPAVHAALSPVIEHNASASNMSYRVHAAPAPMVGYDAAMMMVHRPHAAPAPMVEYDATLMMAHQAHVTPAPMVEYDAAPTVAHWVHAAPATAVEYDASACSSGAGRGEDNRDSAVADYWENRRYSGSPVCPKDPNFREFGHHHACAEGVCRNSSS